MLAAEIEPNDIPAQATVLPRGDVLEGSISSTLDLDFFRVDLNRGDRFSINTFNVNAPRFSPTLPPGLEILDSSGRTLVTSDDGDAARLVAPATGQYFIRVASENVFGTFVGPYGMQSSYTAAPANNESEPNDFIVAADNLNGLAGQKVGGTLADATEEDIFFIDAQAGQTLAVAFAGLSETSPAVEVLDSLGNVLGENQSGTGIVLQIQEDAPVYISLSGNNSSGDISGDYSMVVDLVDDAQTFLGAIDGFESAGNLDTTSYRGNFVGLLDDVSDRDLFEFEIDDIEFLRFDLQFSGSEQIVESGKEMRIYNALGQEIIHSPSGRISTEVDDALVPGTYYLEVLADSPIGSGAYSIEYLTVTNFSLQRDNAVHFMDFDSDDPYLGFNRVAAYAVPEAIDYYLGTFDSRFDVYDVEATRVKPVQGKERVASGIGDFGDIGAGGFGGGGRGIRSSNGNTVNSARETSANVLRRLTTTTVNHEFGHATGLPHARDVQAFMSYVGTAEYLPVGGTYAFQGTDSRRPGNQVYDVRDYLDFVLQPGAQVYVSEQTENAGEVPLDSYLREMSIDYTPTNIYDVGDRTTDVVSGDFNNDGRDDIAIASDTNDTIEIFIAAADGTLGTPLVIPAGGNLGWWTDVLEVGDFDKDGDDDLAFIVNGAQQVSILSSNGDGTFAAAFNYPLFGNPNGLHVADLNDDDVLDFVTTVRNDNSIRVYTGDGDGRFTFLEQLSSGTAPHGVSSGDFDGDGNQDLVATNFSSDNLTLWYGDGAGSYNRPAFLDSGDGPESVTSSDFNNDGRDDLAVVYREERAIRVFLSDPSGQPVEDAFHDARGTIHFISTDDVDQDGVEDLIAGGFGNTLKVLLGSNDGSFTRPISIQTGNGEAMGAVADLDGDGDSEMAITNYWEGSLSLVDEPVDATSNDRVVVFGMIDTDRDVDEYTIDVSAGQRFTFDLDSAEFQYTLDGVMSVLASDGTLITASDDATDGDSGIKSVDPFIDWTFAAADTITIRVEGKLSAAGNYRLKVTPDRAIDSVGPTVIAMHPDNGAAVNSTGQITFYFDSVIDETSLTADNIVVTDSAARVISGTAVSNPLDSTVVWTADDPLTPGNYDIRLVSGAAGITDLSGNPLNGFVQGDFSFPDRSGSTTSPQEDFQTSITINGVDAAPATVNSVSYIRDPYNASRFVVRFNDQLSMPSVHSALYTLRGTGLDGVFDTADDTLTELDATYEAINSTFNSILNLYSRGVVDSGRYRIEADLIDAAGHDVRLFEPVTVSGSVAEANLFTDAALTSPGLTGSYVNQSLRTVNELDWRATQQISGTRVDPKVSFLRSEFGVRSTLGITGGSGDDNWDNFSVQWDGYVVVPEDGVQLLTRSDDSSRFWIDLDGNGTFEPDELFDNGWGRNQPLLSGELTPGLNAGPYQIRIQYQETGGGNEMHLDWVRPGRRVDVGGFIHGPSVTDVSVTPGSHVFTDSLESLEITFSGNLDPSTLVTDNITLLRSDNPMFFDGNDVVVPDSDGLIGWDATRNVAVLEFDQPLLAGFYLLEINGQSGGIANTVGDLLDGEFLSNAIPGNDNIFVWDKKPSGDGIAGGNYRAPFSVSRPLLEITIDPDSISENGGQATATVTRFNADLSVPIVVALAVSDETELRVGSAFVTIPAGSSSATVPVFAVDDDLLDGTQFVGVTATATNFESGVGFVEVTDYETFDLRMSSPSVFENSDTATLTVTRLDAGRDAVVELQVSRPDKLLWSPTQIVMPAGQSQVTVTLIGRDNQILDGDQQVAVTVSSIGMIDAVGSIEVLDYEPLTLFIDDDSIQENGGSTTAQLVRTDTSVPLTATLSVSPNGLLNVPSTISFANGSELSDPFVITAVDNDVLDVVRVATVVASGPGYVSGTDTVNVTDFEELELVTASNTIPENGGAVQMQVRRTDPTGNAIAVLTSTSPGRLVVPTSVQFDDGDRLSHPFFANAIDNDRLEGDQIVTVIATSAGYQLSQTELLITDHEQLTLSRVGDPLTESSGTATYVVTRPRAEGEAVVEISGGAFDSLRLPQSVRFRADEMSVTFTADVVDNAVVAGDQQVSVTVASQGYISDTLTETILDNDVPEFRLLMDSLEVNEGDRPQTVYLTRNTLEAVTVSVSQSQADLLNLPNTLTFLPGRPTVAFQISTPDNLVVDGTRGVDVTFSGAGHPDLTASISVMDDEVASFAFLSSSIELTEGGAPGIAALALGIRPISDVTIAVASGDESQLVVSPTELTFTPSNWAIPQSIELTTMDDMTSESFDEVSVTATVTSGVAFSELGPQTLFVELSDDDIPGIWLEETDGSTIVNEFGLDDEFSLALATRPRTPVQLSIDGATVPEAVFSPSVLTFTPDDWDQPQVVRVSTPLDFNVDRNSIGPVFINVDQASSDPLYADADRRIIGVVHIDSILSDLRIRQEDDRIILVDEFSGNTLRSTPVGQPGGANLETGIRSESVFVEPLPSETDLAIATAGGDDRISLTESMGGQVDGGTGHDVVVLLAAGALPPETDGGVGLRNIEQIDLSDAAVQSLDLDYDAVVAMTDVQNQLHVKVGPEDRLAVFGEWQFGAPMMIAGYASHRLIKDDATIQVTSGSIWQNPFNPYDVDKSGEVSVLDALVTINHLAREGQSELPVLPSEAPEMFYDVNGDGTASVRDALAVINSLASQAGPEGEAIPGALVPDGNGSDQASGQIASVIETLTRESPNSLPSTQQWNSAAVDEAYGPAIQLDWLDDDDEESSSVELDWIDVDLSHVG